MEEGAQYHRPDDDLNYRIAMDEANELGLYITIYLNGKVGDRDSAWVAQGEWSNESRSQGEWVDNVWVDSDDYLYGQPEPKSAQGVHSTPSGAIWSVIQTLTNEMA